MTANTKEQKAKSYARSKWEEGFFSSVEEIEKDFMSGYLAKESEGWFNERTHKPPFGKPVYVHCKIYGYFIATYEQLDKEYPYGNWKHNEQLGILPPTHWHYLPEIIFND